MTQAEAGYREVLEGNPREPEALHWLGVLMIQAGRADQAVPLLEKACALRSNDSAYRHNLGQAYLDLARFDDAVNALRKALQLEPGRAEVQMAFGRALLARKSHGDAEAAVVALRRAAELGMDGPQVHHYLAVALHSVGRLDESIQSSRTAIEKKADYADAHYQLAMVLRAKGELAEARQHLRKALEIAPGFARAWHAMGVMEAEAGRLAEAESLFCGAMAITPAYLAPYEAMAKLMQLTGRSAEAAEVRQRQAMAACGEVKRTPAVEEAIAALEKKVELSPAAAQLQFLLAAHARVVPPSKVPADAVVGLFDRYADGFDDHLRNKLQYRVPEFIAQAVAATKPQQKLDVLDLGCGTGICGELLRPFAATITGVDLSPKMIEKSRARGCYDRLEIGDIVDVMKRLARSFDLLVSADVLIYIGDLAPTFEAAAGSLRPGGRFVFSVEAGEGERYVLRPTRRYAHSADYVQKLAAMFGFIEERFDRVVARLDADQPVHAYLVSLRLP